MFRHPALPGLHAGNAAARRSLKSSGKKATRGHINKAGPSRPPGAALPPPSLQKRDFLPSAFRARSGHSPGPSPRGPNQWEGSFCSGAGGPGSLEGERRPAASCRRAPGSGRPRGPRGARRAARVLVGAHGRREPTPRCGRGAFPRRCRRPPFGAPRLRWSRRLGRRRLRGPGGKWKGQGVKARPEVEPNFAAGGAGGNDACAQGAGAGLTAQLWAVSPEAAPRPPRQWPPHDRALQRIIAARDISADTILGPGRGRGGGQHCSGPRGLAGPGTAPTASPPAPFPSPSPRPRGAQCHPRRPV